MKSGQKRRAEATTGASLEVEDVPNRLKGHHAALRLLTETLAYFLQRSATTRFGLRGTFIQEAHQRCILTSERNLFRKVIAIADGKNLGIDIYVNRYTLRVRDLSEHELLAIGRLQNEIMLTSLL
jgi:hypothetical protein